MILQWPCWSLVFDVSKFWTQLSGHYNNFHVSFFFFSLGRYLSRFPDHQEYHWSTGRPFITHKMKRFRQACKLLVKHVLRFCFFCFSWLIIDLSRTIRESGSNKDVGVPHDEALVGGAPWHDEWGVLPHHFETVPPPREKVSKGGSLKQTRSMPFPSRRAPDELAPAVPSPTSRHTRKNSKVAQLLGIASSPEKARENAADPQGLMSPPLLPMEVDPFSCPLGATIVNSVTPTTQRQMTHPPAPQHTFRPMQSMPSLSSLSVPRERQATHAHVPRVHAPQSTSDLQVTADTAARRAPRQLQRAGYAHIPAHSSRSLSNPPPVPSVPSHYSSLSQPLQPPRVVNLESRSRHGLTSVHTTHRGRHQNIHGHALMVAPNLRKARSSVVLSNSRALPLHAPKPVKHLERPSVETLNKLAESASSAIPSRSKARHREVAVHTVWPPAPVLRPLGNVNAERDAYRTAAIEVEKTCRKINEERALLEYVRDVGDREARPRRRERDPGDPSQRSRHHRRAATEGPRRRKRDVEYHTMADHGYDPTHPKWIGAWREEVW